MKLDYKRLNHVAKTVGDSFYILDTETFCNNYTELLTAFRSIYPNSNIAYSYKTNYIPRLCQLVDKMGGYAEVVSDMEYELALRVGVKPEHIFFNGPYKLPAAVEKLLLSGGVVNVDSLHEMELVVSIAKAHPDTTLHVGIRCNYDVADGRLSRFGVDVDSAEFDAILSLVHSYENIVLTGLHCHFSARSVEYWPARTEGMLDLYDRVGSSTIHNLDLGGAIFGKMPDSLKRQFTSEIPDYTAYAKVAATKFRDKFGTGDDTPTLFIEPGTAVSGDVMKFAAKVTNIKTVRSKPIATVLGSIYNINPTLNTKNPPIEVYHESDAATAYEDLDFGGFTCIESDYLYRGYTGKLAIGDYAVFGNVGSYSVVLKPPFILPNFAVVELDETGEPTIIKRRETFDDIFHTYTF